MARKIAGRFPHDLISRWVLARTALENGRCGEADRGLGEMEQMVADQQLDEERYRDVAMLRTTAQACMAADMGHADSARKMTVTVRRWLDGEPKVALEYQDEKNLMAAWRKRLDAITASAAAAPRPVASLR